MASQSGNKSGDIEISEAPEVLHVRPKRGPDSRDDSPTSSEHAAGPTGLPGYYSEYYGKDSHGMPKVVAPETMVGSQSKTPPVTLMQHWRTASKGWGAYLKTRDAWIAIGLG